MAAKGTREISRDALREQLRQREFAPVYTLYGQETYLRDTALKTIVDLSFSDGDFRDFNENSFSLNDPDNLANALGVARQLPMMATRRVVTITDVRISATGHRDTITEDHQELLAEYFENPSETSIVIFIADELNGVRKMGKFFRAETAAVEFKPLSDVEFEKWAADAFKKAGVEIDRGTLSEFVSRIGADVRRVTNEANKLATAALPTGRVTVELVEELVANTREVDNFALTRELVAGKRTAALNTLAKILDDGGEPVALLGMLNYNYRRLLIAKDLMDRGADRREVAGVLKMHPAGQESFLAAARRVEMKKLVAAMRKLADTDVAIKTSLGGGGPEGSRMQIEMLVCELALL